MDDLWYGLDNTSKWNVLEDYEEASSVQFISLVTKEGVPGGYRRCTESEIPRGLFNIRDDDNKEFHLAVSDNKGFLRPNIKNAVTGLFQFEECSGSNCADKTIDADGKVYRMVCKEEGNKDYYDVYVSCGAEEGTLRCYHAKNGFPLKIYINDKGTYQFCAHIPSSLIKVEKAWAGCDNWHGQWVGYKNEDETKNVFEDNWSYLVEYDQKEHLLNWRITEC